MTSPALSVVLLQPVPSIRLGLGPPTIHFSTLPLLSCVSTKIWTCGLAQSTRVTVPFTVMACVESTAHVWCANDEVATIRIATVPTESACNFLLTSHLPAQTISAIIDLSAIFLDPVGSSAGLQSCLTM